VALTSHSERGRLGARTTNARYDGPTITAKARQTFIDSFLDKVDPTGELRLTNPDEAHRRAEATRKLHYARMAYNSVKARRLLAKKSVAPGGQTRDGANEEGSRDSGNP